MGEGSVVWTYLKSKASSIIDEMEEGDFGVPSHIISRLRSLEEKITNHHSPDFLYDLIEALSECRLCCYQHAVKKKKMKKKKGLILFLQAPDFVYIKSLKKRLKAVEAKFVSPNPPATATETERSRSKYDGEEEDENEDEDEDEDEDDEEDEDEEEGYGFNAATEIAAVTTTSTEEEESHKIIGFEKEAEQIESWLIEEEEGYGFRAVGIVGCGGCGKTALARKLFYGNPRIKDEFCPRVWVSLSEMQLDDQGDVDDQAETVRKYIVEEMKVQEQELEGKRYLLVLDDAWQLPPKLLSEDVFKGSGGAVIVTTRRENVVADANPHLIQLQPFRDDEICWQIFSQAVEHLNLEEMDPNHPNFSIIRDDVKTNCQGLPLAALSLATLLPSMLSRSYFLQARDLHITWGSDTRYWRWTFLPPPEEMEEVAELVAVCWFKVKAIVDINNILLTNTNYSAYLVYQLKERCYNVDGVESTVWVKPVTDDENDRTVMTNLEENGGKWSSSYPGWIEITINIDLEMSGEKSDDFPGWMEMKLGQFFRGNIQDLEIILLKTSSEWKSGLIVRGINFRINSAPFST